MSNDYQTPWSGQVALGGKAQRVAVGINTSAGQAVLYRLELFYIGSDGKLYHRLQDPKQPNGWSNPAILAGEAVGLAVTNLGDGHIAVFYTDGNANLYYTWQDPKRPNGWDGPSSLGVQAGIMAVTLNGDGGLELFYTSGDTTNQLYHQSQSQPDGSWLPAQVIGPSIYALAATSDADGNPVIAYAGADHTLYTLLVLPGQQPTVLAGSSSAPTIYGGALALTSYASGGLALFYIGDSFKLYHYYQVAPGAPWTQQSLPSTARYITAARLVDDTLALFFADLNDTLYYSWPQAQPDGSSQWSAPVLLGGTANKGNSLTTALNADGRLELFYIGDDQNLYHNWQLKNWQTLQNLSLSSIKSHSYPPSLTITDPHEESFGYLNSSQPPHLGAVLWLKVHWLSFTNGSCILMYIEWLIGQAGGGSISQHTGYTHDVTPNGFSVEETAFAFRENERLSSCTLYANGSDLVGLQFATNLDQSFTAGNPDYLSSSTAVQLSDVAGAVLMGFYGIQLHDANIDSTQTIPHIVGLGLWISNSVKSISVQNIRYDLGRATITNQQTQSINSIELVNDTNESQTVTENLSYTLESSSNWSHSEALSVGGSVSLNVGYIPASETGGVTVGLAFTANTQYTLTDTTGGDISQSTNYSYTASATVPPHSKINVDVSCTRATLSVPYVADVVVTYTNGTKARLNTSPGVYSGVQNYDIKATYTTPAGTPVKQAAIG